MLRSDVIATQPHCFCSLLTRRATPLHPAYVLQRQRMLPWIQWSGSPIYVNCEAMAGEPAYRLAGLPVLVCSWLHNYSYEPVRSCKTRDHDVTSALTDISQLNTRSDSRVDSQGNLFWMMFLPPFSSFSLPSLPFALPLPFPPPCSDPLNPARGLGSAASFPNGVPGRRKYILVYLEPRKHCWRLCSISIEQNLKTEANCFFSVISVKIL